ncbi:uncharacterized protein LOC132057762 [Lycium ferocissimum]|uniref:uncharacterized protein LOC132057762 n=1 Tax=Lycium ferocissimum TaxID=112874 RepID=UPI0028169D47|nr:uncharacterized protein LOC132057762 [Lycium ferocissimum]
MVNLLLDLISQNQAGFLRGRSIVENILLTQEIISDIRLRTNKVKKNGNQIVANVVMKLDMTNAYDRLSWLFLTNVMRRMGFSERAVKQGDPLSPTLFILAAEALSRALYSLNDNLWYTGYGMPKWSPSINHLAYADDTIIFASPCDIALRLIMQVLGAYEAASKLLAKVRNKLQGWKGKLLSFGGRAILLKHVLQAMLMHLLSVIDPPSFVITKLHKIFAQFYWSNKIGESNRHWASFIGVTKLERVIDIGLNGKRCAYQLMREVLVLDL